MKNLTIKILGTHCPACQKLTEKRIKTLAGVLSVEVNYETGETKIVSDRDISKGEINSVLSDTEYKVQ